MAHIFNSSVFGVSARHQQPRSGSTAFADTGRVIAALVASVLFLLPCLSARAQTASSYVPSVVVSSVGPVPTTALATPIPSGTTATNVLQPISVSLDACGNIYVYDHGGNGGTNGQGGQGDLYTEIPAGGGTANALQNVGQSFPQNFVGQDPTYANLIAGAGYTNHVNEFPLLGCVPQPSAIKSVGNQGPGPLFYYYLVQSAAGDFNGNTYISTQGTCCITGSYYLIKSVAGGQSEILLANQAKLMNYLAADKQQNAYFVAGGTVYELPINVGNPTQPYAKTPIAFGNYNDPVGLSFDINGNLYVSDLGTSSIYEVPYEPVAGSNPVTYALNLADQFVISSNVKPNTPVAVSARGDVYFVDQKQLNVSALTLGYANFNSVPVGAIATRTINFQFNAAVTPASIHLPTGTFSSAAGPSGTSPCVGGTAYTPSGTTNCQITIAFTPTAVGKQTSSVMLQDADGNSLATAYLEGVGQGPLVTVDPGTLSSIGSGLKSPAGVAVDQAGNTFIADAVGNVIVEIPAGGGAAVSLAVAAPPAPTADNATPTPTPISGPLGVAVDGAGNLFVSDTGNNRVLEIPFVGGGYTKYVSNAKVIASGLKSPTGLFVNTNGDLYIADTGDNTIVYYPNTGVAFSAAQNLGVGLNAPLAVTADAAGDLYIADSGNNQIVEFPNGSGQQTVLANILNPSALGTDSSGALFAVDQGNLRILRVPSVNGALSTNSAAEVSLGVANPYGVALDSSANLYVTDQSGAAAYAVARSQVALTFGNLAVGTSSGPLPLTVESAGNQPLVFGTPYFTETGNSGDFAMTSPTGVCADGVTLAAGTSCDLVTNFTPSASGDRSAVIAFTSNAAVPASVTLSGIGVSPSPTTAKVVFSYAPGPNAPFYGEALTFAATVTPSASGSPTGNVIFVIDGVQVALLPLASGVATLSLNSGLTGGAHSVYAIYKGDAANNGSESTPLAIMIGRAPTTTTLNVTKVAYTNPYSLRHSNAGSCTNVGAIRGAGFLYPALLTDGVGFRSFVTSPGVGVPSGTLTFYSDGRLLNINSQKDKDGNPTISSVTPLVPATGGTFKGEIASDADLLGDGDTLGENNVLVGVHTITVVYSGDTNYLASTSTGIPITVVDVSPTTPVTVPNAVEGAAPYCAANSAILVARPSVPGSYSVASSTNTIPVTANAPGRATFTISSLGNWQGTIAFACPDLPKYTTCTTNPGVATIVSSSISSSVLPVQVTLTITTNVPPAVPTASQSALLWPAATLLGLALLAMRRRVKRIQTGAALFGVALLFFGGMAGLSSCGSGTKNTPGVVTPAGSYPITVTMTGAQPSNNFNQDCSYGCGDTEETMKPDLPYAVPFTLVVK